MISMSRLRVIFAIAIVAYIGTDLWGSYRVRQSQADSAIYRKTVTVWHQDEEQMLRALCLKQGITPPPPPPPIQ